MLLAQAYFNADEAFDCSWRRLAFAYAPTLQNVSAARAKELHDALELEAFAHVIPALSGLARDAVTELVRAVWPLYELPMARLVPMSKQRLMLRPALL